MHSVKVVRFVDDDQIRFVWWGWVGVREEVNEYEAMYLYGAEGGRGGLGKGGRGADLGGERGEERLGAPFFATLFNGSNLTSPTL